MDIETISIERLRKIAEYKPLPETGEVRREWIAMARELLELRTQKEKD